jgi:hypothetical protein
MRSINLIMLLLICRKYKWRRLLKITAEWVNIEKRRQSEFYCEIEDTVESPYDNPYEDSLQQEPGTSGYAALRHAISADVISERSFGLRSLFGEKNGNRSNVDSPNDNPYEDSLQQEPGTSDYTTLRHKISADVISMRSFGLRSLFGEKNGDRRIADSPCDNPYEGSLQQEPGTSDYTTLSHAISADVISERSFDLSSLFVEKNGDESAEQISMEEL